MFSYFHGGPAARTDNSDLDFAAARDPGLFAWALFRGTARFPSKPRRPHRGDLPDVDFSRAEPDPARRRLLFWLLPALLTPGSTARQWQEPATPPERDFGENRPASYIAIVESDESVARRPRYAASAQVEARAA